MSKKSSNFAASFHHTAQVSNIVSDNDFGNSTVLREKRMAEVAQNFLSRETWTVEVA